jgi:alkylhydroperoxidase/carboxymuconolactone decarboxylase family protein YurZ
MSSNGLTAPARVKAVYPDVYDSFMGMRKVLGACGSLSARDQELILIAGFTVARQESGFKVHCKRALELGASAEDVRQAVVINLGATCAIEPVGDALAWVDDVLQTVSPSGGRA